MALQNTKIQLISMVLAAVLSIAYLGNQHTFGKHNVAQNSRAPASIDSVTMASEAITTGEKLLVEQVAMKGPERGLASVGEPATGLESLRFGALEGKYAFKMNGEEVSEISFIENTEDKPTVIADRATFLKKFAEQFGAVSKPEKLSSVLNGDRLVETYKIKSAHGPDRLIQVTVGTQNTFLALETKEAPTLNLF